MDKIERMRNAGQFPYKNETYGEYMVGHRRRRGDRIVTVLVGLVLAAVIVSSAAQLVIEHGM